MAGPLCIAHLDKRKLGGHYFQDSIARDIEQEGKDTYHTCIAHQQELKDLGFQI